jgi:two-component system, NarL family, nitrate/nitrite response regulator NarL
MLELARAASVVALEMQPIRAEGLRQVLAGCEDLRLPASEMTPELALKRVAEIRPAVVLVDGDLGAQEVVSFLKAVRAVSPGSRLVLWIPEGAVVHQFEDLARRGVVTLRRTSPVPRVLEVLRRLARERHPAQAAAERVIGHAQFTPKEREILSLLCQGLKNREIARALGISPSTVKVHLAHMYDKSGIHSREILAGYARALEQANAPADPLT